MCVGNANIDVAASAQLEALPPPPSPSTNNTELQSPTKDTTAAMTSGSPVESKNAAVDQVPSSNPIGSPSASNNPNQPELGALKEVVHPDFVASTNVAVPSIIGRGTLLTPPKFAVVDELDQATRHESTAYHDPSTLPLPPDRSDSFDGSLYTANDTFGNVTVVEADVDEISKDQAAPGLTASFPDPPPNYALIGAEIPSPPPPSAPDSNVDQDVFATGQPPMATSSPVPIVRYVRALDTLIEEFRIG
jgi:hypothetical protein